MPLPEYLPKIKLAAKRKYRQLVKDYGPPPEGYRWLKFGEEIKEGDICASGSVTSWCRPMIIAGRVADDDRWPHARPLPESSAPKSPSPSKVSAEVQTLLAKSKMLEDTIATAQAELDKIKEAIRGLT